ncbi:MAG: acyl-CoA carboxylase subunit beta [Bacteroidota bacterium]|nr:acyl-CoA carboxylase subunit beta [Bacteroidota bacterium]
MDITFNKNEDKNKMALSELKKKLTKVYEGGGKAKLEKQHTKGKMSARERIAYLLDDKNDYTEIGAFAGDGMYDDVGGCPSGGVVVVIGRVSGKQAVIVANDATVKAGAWFPITAKKNLRAQEIAMENRLPIIYLVDSAGVFLPMQDEIFPDKEHFGRIFRNNAKMSAMGIPQISAVMGSCVAGGAYLPIMSDEAIIVKETGTIFLAGSYLVKSAIGEDVDGQTLGGAETHSEISGVTDYKAENDKDALDKIKSLTDKLCRQNNDCCYDRKEAKAPRKNPEEIYGILPSDRTKPYDMREIIERLVDDSAFEEYKKEYGRTILCGYAHIDGWPVGIVANQRSIIKKKDGEVQFGGVIYSDSANKAAHFVMNCNQKKVPLVFLHDVTGFMVGSRSEHGGIIKDGAKMVNAVANSVVPKFSVVIGNSYGAGNYAMNGKAYDPRLIVAWPTAKIAVMSGASAAKTLLQIKVNSSKAQGKELSKAEEETLLKEIQDKYNKQTTPYYAAARLWVDAVIDPLHTRKIISEGITASTNNPTTEDYKTGVIRT